MRISVKFVEILNLLSKFIEIFLKARKNISWVQVRGKFDEIEKV